MRFFGSVLVVTLALGCSHSPKNEAPALTPSYSSFSYLKKGDREPASAPQLLWRPGKASFTLSSASGSGKATVDVNQEMVWMDTEYFQDYRNEYREVVVPGYCSDFQCTSGGKAQSSLWDSYFSAPGNIKARALSNAIQGIGDASAEALVKRGYFRSKPKTWSEFSAEINRAANADVIKKSVATNVLGQYKYANIANLGYNAGSCREITTSCDTYISQLVQVPFTNSRQVERRRIENVKRFEVNVTFTDAVLMATESDTITLKIDENGRLIDIDTQGYNRYSLVNQSTDGKNINLQIKSDSRILRDLSNNVLRQDSYQLVSDEPTFVLDVDPAYIPGSDDPNAQLVVDYFVRTCEYGWTGFCGPGWNKQAMASAPIKESRTVIRVSVPKKHKSDILYTISRRNSRFFNDKATSERSTSTVKMPK
ncbi:hypothetical protein [Bdellovibrio sp. HCB2-146]|uniref:hypothetical protein n=1 Tax=Bdellovibrio sp. HCB2-146 TaxID=3394362 RepID=UPI0039BD3033